LFYLNFYNQDWHLFCCIELGWKVNRRAICIARKGKPSEKVGRKATGLNPWGDGKAAGLPGGSNTSAECISVGFGSISTEVLQ